MFIKSKFIERSDTMAKMGLKPTLIQKLKLDRINQKREAKKKQNSKLKAEYYHASWLDWTNS